MRGKRHQVDFHLLQVDFDLAGALRGVDVKNDFALTADLADCGDVLDDTHFIVHMHDTHQNGVVAQRLLEPVQVEQAGGLRVQVGDLVAFALELATGVQHRLVFGLDRDDVLALLLIKVGRTLDSEVVRFGGAAGPDNFLWIGVHQRRDVGTGLLDGRIGVPAEHVRT